MHRTERWQKKFEAAVDRIERFRADEDPGMRRIANWLVETDANPYGFLEPKHARALESAEEFAALLGLIHHSLLDDGDITFVRVNKRPMIVFSIPEEIEKVDLRTDVERHVGDRRGIPVVYEYLNGVEDFIDAQEAYDAASEASIARLEAFKAGRGAPAI